MKGAVIAATVDAELVLCAGTRNQGQTTFSGRAVNIKMVVIVVCPQFFEQLLFFQRHATNAWIVAYTCNLYG